MDQIVRLCPLVGVGPQCPVVFLFGGARVCSVDARVRARALDFGRVCACLAAFVWHAVGCACGLPFGDVRVWFSTFVGSAWTPRVLCVRFVSRCAWRRAPRLELGSTSVAVGRARAQLLLQSPPPRRLRVGALRCRVLVLCVAVGPAWNREFCLRGSALRVGGLCFFCLFLVPCLDGAAYCIFFRFRVQVLSTQRFVSWLHAFAGRAEDVAVRLAYRWYKNARAHARKNQGQLLPRATYAGSFPTTHRTCEDDEGAEIELERAEMHFLDCLLRLKRRE